MKKALVQLLCGIGTLFALTSVAGACVVLAYQPEVPAELLEK